MISSIYKCIFVHIPRTGGTSIEKQLNPSLRDGVKSGHSKHMTAKQIYSLHPDAWDKYFKFSFVRNPWDRMVSMYYQGFYNNPKIPTRYYGHKSGHSLEEFIEWWKPTKWEKLLQVEYFDHSEMDFIGRFERRSRDLTYISDQIGLDLTSSIKLRPSRGRPKDYTKLYTRQAIKTVENRFAEDIEAFGYKFGK